METDEPDAAEPMVFAEELGAAGFRDVSVERLDHAAHFASLDAMWTSFSRSSAPIGLFRSRMGTEWPSAAAAIVDALRTRFGEGPQRVPMPAWLGFGRR